MEPLRWGAAPGTKAIQKAPKGVKLRNKAKKKGGGKGEGGKSEQSLQKWKNLLSALLYP